jgi:DNA-binding FadR family transcriptional regulator
VAKESVVPFRPAARRRLHEEVAGQLRDAILDGRFAAGTKLPPERELAEGFGVNRTSVREALKVLEGLGLVTVRQGDGAAVQPLIDASLDVLAPMIFHGGRVDVALAEEMTEVLRPLLVDMARLAIERRRPEHLGTLRALRDRIADDRLEREERFRALRDLFVQLSDMTRNRVWQMLARRLRAFLASVPLQEARRRMRRDPGCYVTLIDGCLAALDADRTHEAIQALQQLLARVGTDERPTGRRVAAATQE